MGEHPICTQCADKITELMTHMAAAEKEHESFRRRLNEHDSSMKQLTDLTIAVKSMGEAVERQAKTMEKLDSRLGNLESEPGKTWKKMLFEIAKYIVLAIVGAVMLKNL